MRVGVGEGVRFRGGREDGRGGDWKGREEKERKKKKKMTKK